MRDLVITPFGDDHLVLFPGRPGAVRLPPAHYAQLAQSPGSSPCPDWLASIVQAHWQHDASYDALTRRRGSYKAFRRGLHAAVEAGLPVKLSLIVTQTNAAEVDQMEAMAADLGLHHDLYVNMSPTIHGGAETLPAQSAAHLRARKPFTGCNAGHSFFHVDPHGKASICKIGRDPNIDLTAEGIEGLRRLGAIADSLLLRQGGCTGCQLQGTCGTCMPLVQLYRKAQAPLATYCQHQHPREEETA